MGDTGKRDGEKDESQSVEQEYVLEHVRRVWDGIRPNSPIYSILLSNIHLLHATKGMVFARLEVRPVHINSKRILHGSVSATIIDWAGGMAIATMGIAQTGVSTDIHISYVSSAREGDTLEIIARVSRLGKTLGYTTVEIMKEPKSESDERQIVCTGSHTKYLNFAAAREKSSDVAEER